MTVTTNSSHFSMLPRTKSLKVVIHTFVTCVMSKDTTVSFIAANHWFMWPPSLIWKTYCQSLASHWNKANTHSCMAVKVTVKPNHRVFLNTDWNLILILSLSTDFLFLAYCIKDWAAHTRHVQQTLSRIWTDWCALTVNILYVFTDRTASHLMKPDWFMMQSKLPVQVPLDTAKADYAELPLLMVDNHYLFRVSSVSVFIFSSELTHDIVMVSLLIHILLSQRRQWPIICHCFLSG